MALPSIRVRTAAGGHRVLTLIPTPAPCTTTVLIPPQRIAPLRPTAFLSVAPHNSSNDQGSTRVNDILHQFPFSLPYSGTVYRVSGTTVTQGTNGYWWSQGANSNTNARYLDIRGNYTHPENNYYNTNGFSVHYHPVPQFSRSSLSTNAEKRLDTMKRE